MRLSRIYIAILIPLLLTCFLRPVEYVEEKGICYQGLDEYKAYLASRPPQISVIDGLPDTIIIDSILDTVPFRFSYAVDSFFVSENFRIDFSARAIIRKDTANFVRTFFFPCLSVSPSGFATLTQLQDTVDAKLTYVTDTTSSTYRDLVAMAEADTGICEVNFWLDRLVDGVFCSSTKINSKSVVLIRRYRNVQ